ncbi:Golgi SNAP receptor complex member 1-2 [Mucuna pruriens]|uniref:Golgi SNAP receptor complex member 1-2 n=1 Tax=Mucuna pruriens TaxID=157652 RepID=A0A371HEJ0_MUCPR|nr:Golgi SNAP receptor complex member 1-2 [Mucuna pruriens]
MFTLLIVNSFQEFRRIKGNINSMREHAELLSSVRDDITDFKTSGSMSPRMQLLRERAAIHGNISHIDEVISQAQATRAVLGSQRQLFGDVQGKVKLLGDKFPVIRSVLGSIRRRRSRDTLILSAVIAACTLFLIIYWLSK